jgi:2-keto-4-pentenoate hydratase/2-oxohepta-3-ene-1,7-dioic acid hydratase in catechol pathway
LGIVEGGSLRAIGESALEPSRDINREGVAALATFEAAKLVRHLEPATPLSELRLLAPVPRPQKIIGIGGNYAEHVRESAMQLTDHPVIFAKFPNTIQDPGMPIVLNDEDDAVDYEGELCVVIGTAVKRASTTTALHAAAGFTIANDVSARTWQNRVSQWTAGKSFDSFCPIGPWLATTESIPDPQTLHIETRVDGEVLQSASTSHMVFSVARLISEISRVMTLEPGDLILTGTPEGVGHSRIPPRYLAAGQVVDVSIEKIGTLSNPVRRESEEEEARA